MADEVAVREDADHALALYDHERRDPLLEHPARCGRDRVVRGRGLDPVRHQVLDHEAPEDPVLRLLAVAEGPLQRRPEHVAAREDASEGTVVVEHREVADVRGFHQRVGVRHLLFRPIVRTSFVMRSRTLSFFIASLPFLPRRRCSAPQPARPEPRRVPRRFEHRRHQRPRAAHAGSKDILDLAGALRQGLAPLAHGREVREGTASRSFFTSP